MLCAVQSAEKYTVVYCNKMSFEEEEEETEPVDIARADTVPDQAGRDHGPVQHKNDRHSPNNSFVETTCNTTKQQTVVKDDEPKKRKKWKALSADKVGFNMSLFPRQMKPDMSADMEKEEEIFYRVCNEIDTYNDIVNKESKGAKYLSDLIEGSIAQQTKLTRPDRERKCQKASLQIKDKYCRSLKNNAGRKDLFINHRVFKKINLDEKRIYLHLPTPNSGRCLQAAQSNIAKTNASTTTATTRSTNQRQAAAPVQNLHHSLHETNAPSDIDSNLLNLLINLQHRDLSPEDYDTLLLLDDSVAPKTIESTVLQQFKTDTYDKVDESVNEICMVCLDPYEIGQQRKFLPCNHVFHDSCITMWLENASRNCPVDGLPVDGS